MKTFYFKEQDNIYKIFQVIDKFPQKNKEIVFDINENNDFFKNKWWPKLVLEKANEKNLKIIFVIENYKQEFLMKSFGVNYIWRKVPLHKKIMKIFGDFLANFKVEHSFYKKHYNIFKIMFLFFELGFIVFMVFFIYNLVVPKTDVYIQPYVKIKNLVQKFYIYPENKKENYNTSKRESLPYIYTNFTKSYSLKLPVNDISYIAKPSRGIVKFINNTQEGISLKAYTELVTDEGMIFKLKNWVYIPGKDSQGNSGIAKVEVNAEEKDEEGEIIGVRGNLARGQKLYIRKMYASRGQKLIYAESIDRFYGGETNANGTVQVEDIEIIKETLLKKFKDELKKSIIQYTKQQFSADIPLLYDSFYGYDNIFYNIDAKPGDKIAFIKGDIQGNIFYNSIRKEDLKKVFKNYLKERIISENEFLGWDEDSIQILDLKNISNGLYLITISINALLGYDFSIDYNNVKNLIINEIKGNNIEEAKNIILSHPEIAGIEIKTTDTLDQVSNLKSRIFIHIAK